MSGKEYRVRIPFLTKGIKRLLSVSFAVWMSACDMPPSELLVSDDTDTDNDTVEIDTQETDSFTEQETDSRDTDSADTTCIETVICLVTDPENTLQCFEGLDDDNRTAAMNLSMCVAQACMDVMDDWLSLGLCMVQSCSQETIDCGGTSISEIFP